MSLAGDVVAAERQYPFRRYALARRLTRAWPMRICCSPTHARPGRTRSSPTRRRATRCCPACDRRRALRKSRTAARSPPDRSAIRHRLGARQRHDHLRERAIQLLALRRRRRRAGTAERNLARTARAGRPACSRPRAVGGGRRCGAAPASRTDERTGIRDERTASLVLSRRESRCAGCCCSCWPRRCPAGARAQGE